MIYVLKVFSKDPSFVPTAAQEEAVQGVLQDLLPDAGDIDRNLFAAPHPVDTGDDGGVAGQARFEVAVSDVAPETHLSDTDLESVSAALGTPVAQALAAYAY
jgi:ABC-type transporter Mla subunit MlaD